MRASSLRNRISFGDLNKTSDGQGGIESKTYTEVSKLSCEIKEEKPNQLKVKKSNKYLRSISIKSRNHSELNRDRVLLIDSKYFEIESLFQDRKTGETEILANEME